MKKETVSLADLLEQIYELVKDPNANFAKLVKLAEQILPLLPFEVMLGDKDRAKICVLIEAIRLPLTQKGATSFIPAGKKYLGKVGQFKTCDYLLARQIVMVFSYNNDYEFLYEAANHYYFDDELMDSAFTQLIEQKPVLGAIDAIDRYANLACTQPHRKKERYFIKQKLYAGLLKQAAGPVKTSHDFKWSKVHRLLDSSMTAHTVKKIVAQLLIEHNTIIMTAPENEQQAITEMCEVLLMD